LICEGVKSLHQMNFYRLRVFLALAVVLAVAVALVALN
jgi:hypothetical protein